MSRQRHGEIPCQNFKLNTFRVMTQNFLQASSPGNTPPNDFCGFCITAGFLLVSFTQFKQKLCRNYQVKCYALYYGAVILTDPNVPSWHYKSVNLRNT